LISLESTRSGIQPPGQDERHSRFTLHASRDDAAAGPTPTRDQPRDIAARQVNQIDREQ
jgi:hypothetical protein